MEFGKPIPEADELLEHSLMMPPPPLLDNNKFTPALLKEMARDVDNLINRLPYHRSLLPPQQQQPVALQPPQPTKLPETPIGKYNPIGQMYRYEQAEFQAQVSKPEVRESSKTEQLIQSPHRGDEFSLRDRESVMAEESLDNSEVKFPSHNYYIMFDRKHSRPQPPQLHQKSKGQASRTVCLQRKVQKLQKEVKQLRGGTTSTATNFRRSDGKMKLDRLLNSMIG